jgi:hypothetical protein
LPFVFAIAPWRNDDGDSPVAQRFDQGVCIVPFVDEQRAASDAFEQRRGVKAPREAQTTLLPSETIQYRVTTV